MSAFTASQDLHDLAFRYALAVDSLNADMLGSIFTGNGLICGHGENPIVFAGADGFARMISQVDAVFQRTMHNVFNQTFERDDAGMITGMTTCIASHVLRGEQWTLLDMAMRYHNSYAQEGGIWKYSERRLEVVWVETRPVQKFSASMMDAELKEFR